MAYQPKSYRKFVATAATATLVASAVAPAAAAGFSDVSDRYADAVNYLVENDITNGLTETTFGVSKEVKRGDAAVMIAKALGLDGANAPDAGFGDVPARAKEAVNALKEAGIFNGKSATNFGFTDTMTRGEMALVIAKAYELEGDVTLTFTDVSDRYEQAVQALVENKITSGKSETSFGTGDEITRGEFAIFLHKAETLEVAPGVVEVAGVSAINAKSLKVTFNKAVDTTKAVFEVKKGSVKVNYATIIWNDAKTEATIELEGKFTAGDYTVNVSGLTETALTGTTTVTNERVESVQILSENAVLNSNGDAVNVGYKVVNQYGEDITATTPLTVNAAGTVVNVNGTVTASKGVATIPVSGTVKEGDSIVLTLVHADTGKSASSTVKVSAKAAVSEIAINGLYNKDGKALTETTDFSKDAFYLLVEGKDQYGKVVNEAALDAQNAVIVNQTNALVANVSTNFETIKVNGKDVTALKVTGTPKAGESTVMIISTATGKNASYTVKVEESQRTDAVTFEVPNLAVAGEKLFVPIQVLDKQGNLVTDEKVVTDATRGIKVSGATGATVKTVDGKLGVEVAAGNVSEGYLSLVAVSSTGKSTIANIQVKAAAKPVRVEGVTSAIKTTVLTNAANQAITPANVKIIDQYERELTTAQKTALFTADYSLVISEEKANAGAIALVNTNEVDALAVGTEKVTISIKDEVNNKVLSGSEKSVSFRVTDGKEYVSYQVDTIGNIFDEVGAGLVNSATYNKTLKVYGLLDDGTKVQLSDSEFTVDAPGYLDYSAGVFALDTDTSGGKTGGTVPYATDAKEHKANVTVTVNATGQKFAQEVTVSKVKPTVTAVKVVAESTISTDVDTKAEFDEIKEVSKVASGYAQTTISDLVDFAVVDSYGVVTLVEDAAATTYLSEIKLTATPSKAFDVVITNNNKPTATVADLNVGESASVVASVNGVEKSFVIEGNYNADASQTAVNSELARYENKTVAATNNAGDSVNDALFLKAAEVANVDATVIKAIAVKTNADSILSVDGQGAITLVADGGTPANAKAGTATLTITFTKNGITETKDVTVTVQ
ncbi:S-layer homology domain-containing protein [Cytobacillus sp.]|uniref:S-layer homology domain-containing protein n=1 Tax=Cytobacillus sp. TaxID=2675269 RepID=UPI0035153798